MFLYFFHDTLQMKYTHFIKEEGEMYREILILP